MMRVERRKSRVEGGKTAVALRSYSDSPFPAPRSPLRHVGAASRAVPDTVKGRPRLGRPTARGFTLIELLVVILILSMLAALVLGVAAVAAETARQAQTKHTVERLHTLLTEYYDTLKTRRVRLNPAVEKAINDPNLNVSPAKRRQMLAEARLYAMRELILMEIPDRWSDIALTTVPNTPKYPFYLDSAGSNSYGRTPLAAAYLRRYLQVASTAPSTEVMTDNQGAECLYMIITMACGDGEARSQFKESDIGDTDGDGALEFLDGWGRPINFLRWAPGFDSQIQLNANNLQTTDSNLASYWPTAAAKDHDPFDVYRIDQGDPTRGKPGAFRLVPLIYSGGRDETFGIRLVKGYVAWEGLALAQLNGPFNANSLPKLTPFQMVTDPTENPVPPPAFLGTMNADGTATDNIHNHLMGLR